MRLGLEDPAARSSAHRRANGANSQSIGEKSLFVIITGTFKLGLHRSLTRKAHFHKRLVFNLIKNFLVDQEFNIFLRHIA